MAEGETYELHSHRGGKWRLESEYDERELAIISAGLLLDGGEADAARVVQEAVGPKGKPAYRVVFKQTRGERAAGGNAPKPRARRAPVPSSHAPDKAASGRAGAKPAAAKPPTKGKGKKGKDGGFTRTQITVYVLLLGGLALGAIAALVFLRQIIRAL